MKKSIFRFIILTLTLVLMTGLAIGLSSCANLIESLLGSVTGTETSQQEQTTTTEPTTHTHTIVIDKAVEPTATEDGLTEGKHCSVCDEILVKQEVVPALGTSGLAYEVNADGKTCTITGIGTCTDSVICIGNYINSYKVVAIGVGAFSGCGNITEIKFAANSTITSIGDDAFKNCIKLVIIIIPEGVTTIGNSAFSGCGALTNVSVPATVVNIGNSAFSGCEALENFEYLGTENEWTKIKKSSFWSYGIVVIIVCKDGEIDSSKDNQEPSGGLEYKLRKDKTGYIVTGPGSCNKSAEIIIPSEYNGKPVKEIGDDAFYHCSNLTSITIPDSVTAIGDYAFSGCSNLTSVCIYDIATWCNITFENGYANPLRYAKKLYLIKEGSLELITDLVIPDSVTTIGERVFYNCDTLTSVMIPDSVATIGKSAFANCDNLTNITIPNSVTTIGYSVFYSCYKLTSITIPFVGASKDGADNTHFGYIFGASNFAKNSTCVPDSLKTVVITNATTIDNDAFYQCTSLTSVTIPDSVTHIGSSAFYGCTNLTSVTIPDSVTTIGNSTFSCCTNLTSITIPDSVTHIGNSTFYSCDNLTSVTIPDSVTHIGSDVFKYCNKLVEVINKSSLAITAGSSNYGYVAYYAKEVHNGTTKIVNQNDYLFYTYGGVNYLVGYVGTDTVLNLPDSYNGQNYAIYQYVFYGCSNLTSITIPDSVTSIGDYAFYGCSNLTSITIPDSVTSIGERAFGRCDNLTNVMIGDSVTTIGEQAFYQCTSLTSVTIPDSVTTIGEQAFYQCTSLTSVTIPDSVTTIGSWAFYQCTSLTSVTIPDSVTTIGSWAFYQCTSLTNVTIGDSVITIGGCAFDGCSNLTSIIIDENNTVYQSINGNLYSKDGTVLIAYAIGKADTSFVIPDSVTTIGERAFGGCDNLTSVTIPDSVTAIGREAFYACNRLCQTEDGVVYVDKWAIGYMTTVTSTINLRGNTVGIGDFAFCGCDNLRSVTIPNSVITIGDSAFDCCDNLRSVTIPNSVITIGDYAFVECFNLTNVTIPNSVITIGEGAFSGCSILTNIIIPDSVTSIGKYAFDCCGLVSMTIPFVGASKEGESNTHFGYIFGASSSSGNNFYVSRSLKTVIITGSTRIGYCAFERCSSLTSITIGNGVQSIGEYAFYDCSSLTSITIPDSVTTIGERTFYWCSSLTSITFKGTVEQWNAITFGYDWNYKAPATEVICSDGVVKLK